MEKSQGKTRESNIEIIIFTLFSILLIFYTFKNFNITKKESINNSKLNVTYDELRNKKNELLNTQKELASKYETINSIDDTIKKEKEDVFKLAKEAEEKIINGESNYKIAYITFDDGPYYATDRVLAILKEYKVKATFFTIGLDKDICYDNKAADCSGTYKEIVDNGHTIANHTYSHGIFRGLYSNADSFMNEINKQQELIQTRTGVITNIMRFPGGSGTARSLASGSINEIMNRLRENGYGWVDWSSQDGDGGYLPSYDVGWRNLTGSINENIEVVLFHDYSNVTISLLPDAIKYLEDNGYILLPLFYDSVKVNK